MDINTAFPDPKIEQAGVWLPYEDDAEVHVARVGNPRFKDKLERLQRPFRDMIRRDRLPEAADLDVLCRAMVGTILLGWRNFTASGRPFEFSEENAVMLLKTRMDFRNRITSLATDIENFRTVALAETEGN